MLASIDPTRRGAHDSLAGVAASPRTLAGGASSGVAMVASARPRGRSRPRDGWVGRAGFARADGLTLGAWCLDPEGKLPEGATARSLCGATRSVRV